MRYQVPSGGASAGVPGAGAGHGAGVVHERVRHGSAVGPIDCRGQRVADRWTASRSRPGCSSAPARSWERPIGSTPVVSAVYVPLLSVA